MYLNEVEQFRHENNSSWEEPEPSVCVLDHSPNHETPSRISIHMLRGIADQLGEILCNKVGEAKQI